MRRVALLAVAGAAVSLSLAAQEGADPEAEKPVVEELTQEQLDAELEEMEAALEEAGEVEEFVPQKPLAADLPVALPSDI